MIIEIILSLWRMYLTVGKSLTVWHSDMSLCCYPLLDLQMLLRWDSYTYHVWPCHVSFRGPFIVYRKGDIVKQPVRNSRTNKSLRKFVFGILLTLIHFYNLRHMHSQWNLNCNWLLTVAAFHQQNWVGNLHMGGSLNYGIRYMIGWLNTILQYKRNMRSEH